MNFFAFLNKKSHTILELFIIFAVVVVLISVGLPMYKGMQDSGKLSQAQTELKTMQAAVTSYYLNVGHTYPNSSASLGASVLTTASPKVIRSVLYDPFVAGNSTEYGYQVSSNGKYYVLYSKGPAGNGSASIDPTGVVAITNNAVCVTNGSGCSVGAANTAGAGTATDSCGGCTGGMRCYNGTCVDVSSNTSYCGTNLTVCSGGQICTNGTCCASGQTGCNGTCSTLSSDSNNCGGCGNICPSGLSCVSGSCSCSGGYTNCSGQCKDLQTDNSNCGSCGSVCAGSCISGVCDTVPGAPTDVSATAGNEQATVTFSAPDYNGGSSITSYTVTSSPDGFTSSGSSTTQTVTGLTNGTSYTFTVTATNAVGTGPASAASNAVTPVAYTVPGAPTGVTATAGNASASVTFSAPVSDGGSPITSYTVTSSPGGFTSSGLSTTQTVTGLTNGTSYTFTVTATNAVGTGPASAASNAVTPVVSVPGAPTGVTATAGNASASVTFSAPASDGGSPITSYTVTSSPGGFTSSGLSTTQTVTGLTNGTSYTFTVTATNAVGTGPASSASNSVTPACLSNNNVCSSDAQCCSNICYYTGCFVPGTKILLANGRIVEIQDLKGGDILKGAKGGHNKLLELMIRPRQDWKIYAFNGGRYFVTDSHSFMTTDGWKALNPQVARQENPLLKIGQLKIGDELVTLSGKVRLNKIEFKTVKDSVVYNPKLDGGHDYYADGFLVHNVLHKIYCSSSCSVPSPPTGTPTTSAVGNTQITVSFTTPPTYDGGCAITSYKVTSSPGSIQVSGAGSPLIDTGLIKNTNYTFTVTATNSAGTSTASTASASVKTTCFIGGTKILLAYGRMVSIEKLKVGDVLLGSKGARNKVIKLVIRPKADYKIYAFNGGRYFVTKDHALMTTNGWEAIDPQGALLAAAPQLNKIGQLKIGDELVTRNGLIRITKIGFIVAKDSFVYNAILDGNHDFYADGFLAHNMPSS